MGSISYQMYRPLTHQEVVDSFSCSAKANFVTVLCRPVEIPEAVVELIELEITSSHVTKDERQVLIDFLDSVLVKEEEDAR